MWLYIGQFDLLLMPYMLVDTGLTGVSCWNMTRQQMLRHRQGTLLPPDSVAPKLHSRTPVYRHIVTVTTMADPKVEVELEHETLPMPELDFRWVHTGSQYLDLLPTPITTAATIYKPFSPDESRRIQEAWDAFTPEERQKAIHDWGRKEGEGFATPATKGKDKDKEKERRGSNVSARSVEGEPVRSGEEQPREDEKDGDGKYKDFLAQAQQEYENLELIAGVPVSQVCRLPYRREGLQWNGLIPGLFI